VFHGAVDDHARIVMINFGESAVAHGIDYRTTVVYPGIGDKVCSLYGTWIDVNVLYEVVVIWSATHQHEAEDVVPATEDMDVEPSVKIGFQFLT
jgi:hypothetical protein